MSLFGDCAYCGEADQLRYKPHVPRREQTRPTICHRCRDRCEEEAADRRRAQDLAGAEYEMPPYAAIPDDEEGSA